jgi:hypothetical protein
MLTTASRCARSGRVCQPGCPRVNQRTSSTTACVAGPPLSRHDSADRAAPRVRLMPRRRQLEQLVSRLAPQRLVELPTALVEQLRLGQLIDAHPTVDATRARDRCARSTRHRPASSTKTKSRHPCATAPRSATATDPSRTRSQTTCHRAAAPGPSAAGGGADLLGRSELAGRRVRQADKPPLRKQQRAQATIATDAL